MRTTDKPEQQPLGAKVEKPPMPEPHRKVAEGVYKAPDGKLYTNVKSNEAAK